MEKARREAQEILDDARRTANQVSEELKQLRKQMRDAADAQGVNQRQADLRRSINEAEERLSVHNQPVERPQPTRAVQLGDTVELLKLGTKASVIAINKDGTYTLQAGILKLTARPEEVYLLEDANKFQVKKPRPAHSGREMKAAAMPTEIDLRGMDSIEAICVLDRFLDEACAPICPLSESSTGKEPAPSVPPSRRSCAGISLSKNSAWAYTAREKTE